MTEQIASSLLQCRVAVPGGSENITSPRLANKMATAILDIDVEYLPTKINNLDWYERVLLLIRFRGRPVGQVWLPVTQGRITRAELCTALAEMADLPLWQSWLHRYLDWNEPATIGPAPKTATIAVCTHDRPDDLRRCLEALMRLPDDGQEILIVDNCPSTDVTCELVQAYPNVHYVREDRPGLNVARNRALREARHDIVAFNDDGAMPEPGWLRALLRNFNDSRVLCVTGLTMPLELETKAQEWFERYSPFQRGFQRVVYGVEALGLSSNDFQLFNRKAPGKQTTYTLTGSLHPLVAAKVGTGANMALRRSILDVVGPFDEALDAGTPTCSGGDTEMFSRILASGHRVVYEPAAVSWYRHRRTWEALRKAIYGYGVGVYATWTRNLLYDRELTVPLLAWSWFWHDQLPSFIRALLRRPGSVPLDLLLAELCGCLAGPFAYLASQKKLRESI